MYSREREELIKRGLSFTVGMLHSENLEGGTAVDMAAEADSALKKSIALEVRLFGSSRLMKKFAIKDDWKSAETLLRIDPSVIGSGGTALHVAAAVKNTKFVRELVKIMSEDDLLKEDDNGCTAFIYAVASGEVEIAALMREKNPSLITTRQGNTQMMPLQLAAFLGKKVMFSYLYGFTRSQDFSTDDWFQIFIATLGSCMYDEALDILKNKRYVAIMTNGDGTTALHHLARFHIVDNISARKEAIFNSLVTLCAYVPCLSCFKKKFEQPLMPKKALLLAEKLWEEIQASEEADVVELITNPSVLHDAAKVGNAGFIPIFTRTIPDLIFNTDANNHTIFHVAVLERQEDVFRLIYKTRPVLTELMMVSVDDDGNNILHLAGKLAPPNRLKIVGGAAFQMQRELWWFKTIEKIVPPVCLEMKNKNGYTPRELFSQQHAALVNQGETWMKNTTNYCLVVATLIATVVFASAISIPGGYNGDSGIPVLLHRIRFTHFLVSDGAAMLFSIVAIMTFLIVLMSRYHEDDFIELPMQLMFGFSMLYFSILAAISAFTMAFFLVFNEEWLRVPAWVVASLCQSLFVRFFIQNYRIYLDTFRTAFRTSFRHGKYSLY